MDGSGLLPDQQWVKCYSQICCEKTAITHVMWVMLVAARKDSLLGRLIEFMEDRGVFDAERFPNFPWTETF